LIAAAIRFLSALAAGFNEARFLAYRQEVSSMLMALGFAFAAACYGWVLCALGASAAEASELWPAGA
jgi:hypothetical protein